MKKLSIGILSDSPFICTGYSDQGKQLANLLIQNNFNVYYFAHCYTGQNLLPGTTLEDGRIFNFNIVGQAREPYFKDVISQYVKDFKIDVLVILLDTFMLYPWFMDLDLSPAKTIFWFPSDGGGALPLACESILRKINHPVSMAEFGQKQCKKVHNLDTDFIPHAVDVSLFKKLPDNERKLLRLKWGIDNKFVVGCVARNQGRKMLDRELKAFSIFAKNNPDAILLMHTDPQDSAQVFPMFEMIKRLGIENRVLFTGTKYYKGFDYRKMYEIYNLMDVFFLTTSGEGFGIPIVEAMACEVPCIVTDYTTTKELVIDNNAGLGIKLVGEEEGKYPDVHGSEVLDGTLTGSWMVERGVCSIYDAVMKLNMMKHFPDKMKEYGLNGRKAVLEKYNWNVTIKKWIDVLTKLGREY